MTEDVLAGREVLMDVTNSYEVVQDVSHTLEVSATEIEDEEVGAMESVIHSDVFREELQEMVAKQISESLQPASQPLYDLISLRQRYGQPDENRKYVDGPVIPVADIRGVDTLSYSKGEKLFRCKLASCYHLMDLYDWSDGMTSGSITARMSNDSEDCILVAPSGLMCDEVTASSLVKASVDGAIVDAGTTGLDVDPLSLALHSALYASPRRSDIKTIMHITSTSAISMSLLKTGLLQLSPDGVVVGDVTYYDRGLTVVDRVDRESIAETLGPTSKVLFIRGYGILICGDSIDETFHLAFHVMSAIEIQLSLLSVGVDNIHMPSTELCQNILENSLSLSSCITGTRRQWNRGQLEFEAMMRQLDNAGYQTGYVYLSQADRTGSDAELAPSTRISSSLTGSDRDLARLGSPHKITRPMSAADRRATPNIYQQMSESAKKITKWVSVDIAPMSRSVTPNSGRTSRPNQFAPQGINPAELKEKVKAIRQDYFADKVTAGPQSRILEGINWDEAQNLKEGQGADGVIAVSKGVIQRDHQHAATITGEKLFQPPNPFNRMTEDDVDSYKVNVEKQSQSDSAEPLESSAEDRRTYVEEEHVKISAGHVSVQGDDDAVATESTDA